MSSQKMIAAYVKLARIANRRAVHYKRLGYSVAHAFAMISCSAYMTEARELKKASAS